MAGKHSIQTPHQDRDYQPLEIYGPGERTPRVPITAETIRGLRIIHCIHDECAAFFGIPTKQFRKALKDNPQLQQAYDEGAAEGTLRLRRLQWRHAQINGSPGVAMTIHLAKHMLGQTDKRALEINHTGEVEVRHSARERLSSRITQLAVRGGPGKGSGGSDG